MSSSSSPSEAHVQAWRSCFAAVIGAALFALVLFFPRLALAVQAAGDHVTPDVTSHAFGNSKAVAFVFWFFAVSTLGGAIFVITRRNMVTAVMGMVGTFFAIAGLFLMLYASFLAVMQVLVYAGAIMVLFVFVIMILNRPEEDPWALQGLLGKAVAALGLLYIFRHLAKAVWTVKDTQPLVLDKAKLGVEIVLNQADPKLLSDLGVSSIRGMDIAQVCESSFAICRDNDFGSVQGVGYTLFTNYLFPFEAVSIVLLVAVVGAITIARPANKEATSATVESEEA